MMKKFLFAILAIALALCLLPAISKPANAADTAELTEVNRIYMNGPTPAIGMAISDLTVTVTQGAVLEGVHVYDAYTGEEITEGVLEENVVYVVRYVFDAAEGTKFKDSLGLNFNTAYFNIRSESETRAYYQRMVTSCTYFNTVRFTVPEIHPGMTLEEFTVSLPENATYTITDFQIIDLTDETADWDSLQPGHQYRMSLTIMPQYGYYLGPTFYTYCNSSEMVSTQMNEGTYGTATLDFSLDVGDVTLTGFPSSIIAGSAKKPTIRDDHPMISVTQTQWVDTDKQPVTTFEDGNTYYLAISLKAFGLVGDWDTPVVNTGSRESFIEKIDNKNAVVYIHYLPIPDIGRIRVTTHGIEKGLPLSGVTATIDGNAVITRIEISKDGRDTNDEFFENGYAYRIYFYVAPQEGYRIGDKTAVEVDGKACEWNSHSTSLSFGVDLNTKKQITSAKVSISGVGLGKSISKVKVSVSGSAKYYLYDVDWYATDTSSSTFKKGVRYYLNFCLKAKEGYCFSEDITITVGGKKAYDISLYYRNEEVWGTIEYEYVTEVTKVSLPAMPKSITPGTTLPTNFKVSSSAKYTLEPVWLSMNTMESVTMANKNGCYILAYVVTAKDGCEFTEDTVFYVDGKKVKPVVVTAYYAQIMKPYNVGLTVVDRIDLTLPEPEHGAAPGEVTVAADAPYAVATAAWGVNTTGKLEDGGDTVTTFQNYKYHFLALEIQTNPGYIFADKVTLYINGDKYTTLEDINLGVAYQTAVCFGKLGEIAKLTAPELSVKNLNLSWHGVPNAEAYEIYRATSKSGKYTKVATVTDISWVDAPVEGKTYYYKVKAIFTPDTSKNSSFSNSVSIAYKCDAPVIEVVSGTTGKPVISWEKVSGAKKYTVYRATSETGKYTKLGTTTKLTYTDSKAKTGTTYFYKVIANASKSTYNSSYSNIVSCDCICSAVTVTAKVDAATGKPSLSWKKVDGAAGYRILRQLQGEEDFTVIAQQTAVTFLDTTAPVDTKCVYLVQVMGKTAALDSQMSREISVTSGIAKPVLKTSIDASGKPELRWQTVEGAVKYEIYRSTKSTKGYTLLTTVETTGYTDDSVAAGKTYYYKVVAVGQVSESAESSYAKLSGKCANPVITIENSDSGKPVLSWEKVTGAKKYTVYRATSESGKYTKLGTTSGLTYTDSKAAPGKVYFYKIVANASSSKYNSAYSNLVSCGVNCGAPTVKLTSNTNGVPVVTWSKVTGAVGYKVMYMDVTDYLGSAFGPYGDFEEYHQEAYTTKTTFTLPDTEIGRLYMIRVVAVAEDEAFNSQPSEDGFISATCATPNLTGKVGDNKKPVVSWNAVEGATKYLVYRSTSKTKNFVVIDEADEVTTFEDLNAKKGKTYYYKIVAVCYDGSESAFSNTVKVKSK